jgi:hypothetical protein
MPHWIHGRPRPSAHGPSHSTPGDPSSSRRAGRSLGASWSAPRPGRHAVRGGEWALAVREGDPVALAVGVELRHVERAVVERRRVGTKPPGLTLSRVTNLSMYSKRESSSIWTTVPSTRVSRGAQQRVASRRAGDFHRCVGGDAACPGRRLEHRPAAVLLLDLEHRHAVRGLRPCAPWRRSRSSCRSAFPTLRRCCWRPT